MRLLWGSGPWTTAGAVVLAVLVLGTASCRSPHESTRNDSAKLDDGWAEGNRAFQQVSYGPYGVDAPQIADAEFVEDDELCETCHETYVKAFAENVHRGDSCESCHGPASRHLETRGKEPGLILSFKTLSPAESSELCLKCHEEDNCASGSRYRYSKHAHCSVSCTDCHSSHYNVPPGTPATTEPGATAQSKRSSQIKLTSLQKKELPSLRGTSNALCADSPGLCLNCHTDKQVFQEIAGPHQICGPNGFVCTTCHDPHGQIVEESRKDLCLECHNESTPGMTFHSSIHDSEGVACTDCHNPHPGTAVDRLVNISHYNVKRPNRLPMSVDEPDACYKCHPEIFGKTRLPSHHPIREGKMTCSDCHDAHGQMEGNLIAETLNLVCWKCHAEKQGPFVYEHPPVTEDCSICHEPHGTVANNLLRQPATFLCLRCHSGHRERHGGASIDMPENAAGFYTDCSRCHNQIHGSDLHGTRRSLDLMR